MALMTPELEKKLPELISRFAITVYIASCQFPGRSTQKLIEFLMVELRAGLDVLSVLKFVVFLICGLDVFQRIPSNNPLCQWFDPFWDFLVYYNVKFK